MRERSFARPNEKLRGTNRRIRALERWVATTKGFFPDTHIRDKRWFYRIPVLDRLVNPPTTNKFLQSKCASLFLEAACNIAAANTHEKDFSIVTTILRTPHLHSSTIEIFFNIEELRRMFFRNNSNEKISLLNKSSKDIGLSIVIPANFCEKIFLYQNFEKDSVLEEKWCWVYEKDHEDMINNLELIA